jgi:anti-sigma regulatory factor (Ser/Thr protein kinase)
MPESDAVSAGTFSGQRDSGRDDPVAGRDWSRTPLGPIESWPGPLRTAAAICLESRYGMCILWGPDLVTIYNDTFAPLLDEERLAAPGTPLSAFRPEVRERLEPVARRVLETGRGSWHEDRFAASFSPIRDDSGAVTGVFTVVHDLPRASGGPRDSLASGERDRAREMEDVALTLQRSLLPRALPDVLGAELCGRYVPASESLEIGGDFYDATALGDGRLVLTIGDVAGHGVLAAAVMGQVRQAVRAYAFEGHPPATLMDRLDLLVSDSSLAMTTCLCGIFDPASGELRFANAGHPPPLLRRADGSVERIVDGLSHPLGVTMAHRHVEARVTLELGESLLLYTDGLVERRGEIIDAGIDRLAGRLADGLSSAAETCERIVAGLEDNLPDDAAVLVVARTPMADERLHIVVQAHPNRLADVRRRLTAWLTAHGASRQEANDVVLAAHEAAMNAIEHAYGPGDAEIAVTAALHDGAVEIAIHDHGRWRDARSEHRGRGRSIMSALMDDVTVDTGPSGSTVRMSRRLDHHRAG